jgi:hypothetical protein
MYGLLSFGYAIPSSGLTLNFSTGMKVEIDMQGRQGIDG